MPKRFLPGRQELATWNAVRIRAWRDPVFSSDRQFWQRLVNKPLFALIFGRHVPRHITATLWQTLSNSLNKCMAKHVLPFKWNYWYSRVVQVLHARRVGTPSPPGVNLIARESRLTGKRISQNIRFNSTMRPKDRDEQTVPYSMPRCVDVIDTNGVHRHNCVGLLCTFE